MLKRQIVLDTETTGIRVEDGHRIIEIGCVEMIDRKLTGNNFHYYLNPEREVEQGALAVHGITNEFLKDKPYFASIATDLVAFLRGAELIIHNAAFDIGFLNHELRLFSSSQPAIDEYCQVTCTLQMARKLHVGQRNNLDALCKRYKVDLSKRELHGALLDSYLLAQVYLIMTGGQGSFFENVEEAQMSTTSISKSQALGNRVKRNLVILNADENEISTHVAYLQKMKDKGKCLWDELITLEGI